MCACVSVFICVCAWEWVQHRYIILQLQLMCVCVSGFLDWGPALIPLYAAFACLYWTRQRRITPQCVFSYIIFYTARSGTRGLMFNIASSFTNNAASGTTRNSDISTFLNEIAVKDVAQIQKLGDETSSASGRRTIWSIWHHYQYDDKSNRDLDYVKG